MTQPTIQQAYDQALRHHQAGRLNEAEQSYRQVLSRQPDHPGALNHLGVIANQRRQGDVALDLIRRSIALNPSAPDAHCNLGIALRDAGQLDEAIAAFHRAITLNSKFALAHANLGIALKDKGQLDLSIAALRKAIALSPDFAEARINLGNILKDNGQLEEAMTLLRQAIALNPGIPEAHNNLGAAQKAAEQLDEAIASFRRAIALRPDYAEAHNNLGIALQDNGQLDEAIAAIRQAIALKPDFAQAHNSLGSALRSKGQLNDSVAAIRRAIALSPDYPDAFDNLGSSLHALDQLQESAAAFRQAIALRPNYAEAFSNLGITLKDLGRLDEAIAASRQAMSLKPDLSAAHSNLILVLHYHPEYDAKAIAQELDRWNRQHAQPLRKFIQPHSNDRAPDRRLKIGYISPDFRNHVVGRNLLHLFQHHDRRQFEITCYANVPRPDAMTRQFQENSDAWRDIVPLPDERVARQITDDQIDILVDLSLHTGNNRLLVFARKPAPIQVTFGGYPGSTGLTAIDYRLTDPYLDPPGEHDDDYVEKSIRLPSSFWCYDPLSMDAPAEPNHPLPALENNFITFGCLNNFCKINDTVLQLWSKVLRRLPNSRLILLGPNGSARRQVEEKLQREQFPLERLQWTDRLKRKDYMDLYRRIDLGLETWPYNGHTTSLDSLWMGVPVATLSGNTVVGRAGRSQLTNLGLPELIAQTPQQYVQIVVDLAGDLPRLSHLRQTLRQRLLDSPLCDSETFTRGIEAGFRQMWRTWCQTPTP
jgi:predicted O-linked N-acetylglucosamine transferase (SPINDLY family)